MSCELPDISDVQVIIHTAWEGEPPDVIEDQVTYPIVTSLLAAPRVKAVRAQTMFGDAAIGTAKLGTSILCAKFVPSGRLHGLVCGLEIDAASR